MKTMSSEYRMIADLYGEVGKLKRLLEIAEKENNELHCDLWIEKEKVAKLEARETDPEWCKVFGRNLILTAVRCGLVKFTSEELMESFANEVIPFIHHEHARCSNCGHEARDVGMFCFACGRDTMVAVYDTEREKRPFSCDIMNVCCHAPWEARHGGDAAKEAAKHCQRCSLAKDKEAG